MGGKKDLNQWRTFFLAAGLGLGLGFAFAWGVAHQSEVAEKMFGSLCMAYISAVGLMAGRSALQHAAAGGGLRGALGALAGGSTPAPQAPAPPSS